MKPKSPNEKKNHSFSHFYYQFSVNIYTHVLIMHLFNIQTKTQGVYILQKKPGPPLEKKNYLMINGQKN